MAEPATSDPTTILVIDDEADIRRLLTVFLRRQGYEVVEAEDGQEGLDIFRASPADVVVTDVVMPRKDGMAVLQELRASSPETPVIMITGKPALEAAVECMRNGAFDYLSKPFDFRKIRGLIAEAVCQRRELAKERPDAFVNINHRRWFGHYRVIEALGEGNVGIVFLVEKTDEQSAARYALKVLKPTFIQDSYSQVVVERFMREARATAQVAHPNVIGIVEYGITEEERIPFIVMEYFAGRPLSEFIREPGRLDLRQKVVIIRQIADATAAIHARGITHRDIKPHNVMVDEDLHLKLMDFGIARMPDSSATQDHELLGSPAYLAPEAFERAADDPRSDIFSLGVLAYELLLGEKPFKGDSIPAFAHAIRTQRPLAPRRLQPDFPPRLQQILARMLKKDPDERYLDAASVVRELDEWLSTGDSRTTTPLLENLTRRLGTDWQ